jgi:Flp pilus assembly protein CpaB
MLAALAAALAGAIVDGYGSSVASSYGELQPVVVTSSELTRGRPLDPSTLSGALEVRRVPARFVPPGALRAPAGALGLEPVADLPAGSYLVASALRPPPAPAQPDGLAGGRRPVEIRVAGAAALEASGPLPPRPRVDVVVTTQPTGPGPGRTRVAAEAVPLISLDPGKAILGLSREQALELIAAESFARQVTLLVSPR